MRKSFLNIINNQRGGSFISILGGIVGAVIGGVAGGVYNPYGYIQGFMWGYGIASAAEVFITGFPSPDLPSLGDISATYNGPSPVDTIREGIPIARAYGRCQIAGNKVRTNDVNTESNFKIILSHCVGPVSGIISYKVNDIAWASLTGSHSYNFYTGTTSQLYDTRFIADSFGPEIIGDTSCATDFFDDVTAPWTHDAVGEEYDIDGSQASSVSMSLFSSGVTKNHYYRITSTIGNYSAGYVRFGFGGGTVTPWYSGNTTPTLDIFCNATDSNFFVEADADYIGSLQYLSLKKSTGRSSPYRGIAYSAFTFSKEAQIGWNPNITAIGDWLLCTPIGEVTSGGSDKIFSRNPAVIMYDWYINVEGYTYNEMNIAEFRSLETFCNALDVTSGTSRYTFDYNFDTSITINDAKKLIWQSFNGACILDQGLIKPVWESAKEDIRFAFTPRNIIKGSFTWSRPRVPNIIRVYYIDGDSEWEKTFIELKNEESIRVRGEILHEENCWFINNQYTARKRAQFIKDKAETLDFTCKLTSFSSAGHLEIYDRVTVTHPLPGWNAKDFIVKSIAEDALGRPTFYLEAFYAGIYHGEPAVEQSNYASELPNIFNPMQLERREKIIVSNDSFEADYTSVSAAINAISATRSLVYVKNGVYYFDGKINLPNKNIDIIGESRDGVIFVNPAGDNAFVDSVSAIRNVNLNNFTVSSQNISSTSCAMMSFYGEKTTYYMKNLYWKLEDNFTDSRPEGMTLTGDNAVEGIYANNIHIENSEVSGGLYQFTFSYCNKIFISNENKLHNANDRCIDIVDCENVKILNNDFEQFGERAILFDINHSNFSGTSRLIYSIDGNNFKTKNIIGAETFNPSAMRIVIQSSTSQLSIQNNIVHLSGGSHQLTSRGFQYGIYLTGGSKNNNIIGNSIYLKPNSGVTVNPRAINLGNIYESMISQNTIESYPASDPLSYYGIYTEQGIFTPPGVSGCLIIGNNINLNNSAASAVGIQLNAGTTNCTGANVIRNCYIGLTDNGTNNTITVTSY